MNCLVRPSPAAPKRCLRSAASKPLFDRTNVSLGPSPNVPPGKKQCVPKECAPSKQSSKLADRFATLEWHSNADNDVNADVALQLAKCLRHDLGDDAFTEHAISHLAVMNLRDFQIPHGRFNDTIARHIRALLKLVNDPDAFSVFVMAKCPTRPGAMKDKTTTHYKGEVSLDFKVGTKADVNAKLADISHEDMDACRKGCKSMQAGDIILGALGDIPGCYASVANSRQKCRLKKRSHHCADPTVKEGKYCAIRLNFLALICAAFGIDLTYLCIGGRTAMRNINKNLKQEYFSGSESCVHLSLITSLNSFGLSAQEHIALVSDSYRTVLRDQLPTLRLVYERLEASPVACFIVPENEQLEMTPELRALILSATNAPEDNHQFVDVLFEDLKLAVIAETFILSIKGSYVNFKGLIDSKNPLDYNDSSSGKFFRFKAGKYNNWFGEDGIYQLIKDRLEDCLNDSEVDGAIKTKITEKLTPKKATCSYKCVTLKKKKYFYAKVGDCILKKGFFKLEADAAFAADKLRIARGAEARKWNMIVYENCESDGANFGTEEAWMEARDAEMERRQLTEISAKDMKINIDQRIKFTLKK